MIVTFGSINVDFIFSLTEMPQPGQTLLADGFRTEAGVRAPIRRSPLRATALMS